MQGAIGDFVVGPQVDEYRGILKISYPMEHGQVTTFFHEYASGTRWREPMVLASAPRADVACVCVCARALASTGLAI